MSKELGTKRSGLTDRREVIKILANEKRNGVN